MLQTGGVGCDNIDTVDHAAETDRVEDLRGTVYCERLGGSHDDQTDSSEAHHDGEAFGAAPEIEQLSGGNVDCSCHGVRNDGDYGQKRVLFEPRCHVGCEIAGYRRLESVVKYRNHML